MTDMKKSIARVILFLISMLFFFSGINGYCNISANQLVNNYRGGYFTVAGVLVIFVGALIFFAFLRTFGVGKARIIFILTFVLCVPCLIYHHYRINDLTVINVEPLISGPVVGGYNGEGYPEQDAQFNQYEVDALLNSIESDERRNQIEELLNTSELVQNAYENYDDFVYRDLDELHNGDEIHVSLDFDEDTAKKYHVSFDNMVATFEVEGLPEKPEPNWTYSNEELKEMAIEYAEAEQGVDVKDAIITNPYDGDSLVEIKVVDADDDMIEWYTIDRESLLGEDFSGDPIHL